jgi:hypothetical protein
MHEDEVAKLPAIEPAVVDAITDMIIRDTGCLRPPEKAAALMALIVELHKLNRPFPRREVAAAAIHASVSTVDAALSTHLDPGDGSGYLQLVVETSIGNVQRRNSVVRERFYIPSDDLLRVADRAKRKRV